MIASLALEQEKAPHCAGLSHSKIENIHYGVGTTADTAFEYPLSVPLVSTDVAT